MNFLTEEQINNLCGKKELSVLITDSGLGGLSIYADVLEGFKNQSGFEKITLTYYNAWPEQDRGYNRIEDHNEKVKVFSNALGGTLKFNPDIILIACNTLSVIYSETDFSTTTKIPVVDIVDFGVNIIHDALSLDPGKLAVVLGTLTTAESEEHKKRLIKKGIAPERIISQACDQLATNIEKGPDSAEVTRLIEKYTAEAGEKTGSTTADVTAALCCTHFGYSDNSIRENLQKNIRGKASILNPNREMARYILNICAAYPTGNPNQETEIIQNIVSRIEWDDSKVNAIAAIIKKTSPMTAKALKNYSWLPELFSL